MTERGPIRVLVIDDSAFSRRTITRMLESSPLVEVIDSARDGEEALRKTFELQPDLVTLDLEMPRMDGFTYLRLAQVLLLTEDYQRGIEIMRRGVELAGPTTVRSGKHVLAPLLARAGRRQEAIAILEELTEQSRTTYVPVQTIPRCEANITVARLAIRQA